jgi:uncharacterized protein YifN (PemK superfamily)
MNKKISIFVDRILIDENATKDLENGYHLDISDIPKGDTSHFLDLLFEQDPAFREMVTEHMQCVIDERLQAIEQDDRYSEDQFPSNDKQTGELIWTQGAFV